MGKYQSRKCNDCGLTRPVDQWKTVTRETLRGRSGGSVSGNPFAKNTLKSIRVHTGRKYYSIKTVTICKDKKACGDPDYYERLAQKEEEKRLLEEQRKKQKEKDKKAKEAKKKREQDAKRKQIAEEKKQREESLQKQREEKSKQQSIDSLVTAMGIFCSTISESKLSDEVKVSYDDHKRKFRTSVSDSIHDSKIFSKEQKEDRSNKLDELINNLSIQTFFKNWMEVDPKFLSLPLLSEIPKGKSFLGFLGGKYEKPPGRYRDQVRKQSQLFHANMKYLLTPHIEEILREEFGKRKVYSEARSKFFPFVGYQDNTSKRLEIQSGQDIPNTLVPQISTIETTGTQNQQRNSDNSSSLPSLKLAIREIDESEHCVDIITRIFAPYIASADGFVTQDERQWIESELGLDTETVQKVSEVLNHPKSREIAVKLFVKKYNKQPRIKEVVINNLLNLAIIDGHLDDREIESITSISREIRMSQAKLKSLIEDSESVLAKQKRDKLIISDDIDDDPYDEFDEFLD